MSVYGSVAEDEEGGQARQEVSVRGKGKWKVYLYCVLAFVAGLGLASQSHEDAGLHTISPPWKLVEENELPSGDNFNCDDSGPDACTLRSRPVLSGYDVVAYFSLEADELAVKGSNEFVHLFRDYPFYFSNRENLEKFVEDPEKYAPQFGGFCAYGIAAEEWWTWECVSSTGPMSNPNSWLIFDGKLYVFMYALPKAAFMQGGVAFMASQGHVKWEAIENSAPNQGSYFNTGCYWRSITCGRNDTNCV